MNGNSRLLSHKGIPAGSRVMSNQMSLLRVRSGRYKVQGVEQYIAPIFELHLHLSLYMDHRGCFNRFDVYSSDQTRSKPIGTDRRHSLTMNKQLLLLKSQIMAVVGLGPQTQSRCETLCVRDVAIATCSNA